jgi:protein subunit release factor A
MYACWASQPHSPTPPLCPRTAHILPSQTCSPPPHHTHTQAPHHPPAQLTSPPLPPALPLQDERSQHQNRAKAFKILRARLYEVQKRAQAEALAKERRSAIGTGDRNERIRTYNYPQGRVTDHRVGVTLHDMAAVMSGEALEEFLEPLMLQEQVQLLEDMEAAG